MLNKLIIKNKLSVPLLALSAAILSPNDALAAFSCMNGDMGLFKTIACKITTTLYDIREIVYILGGFGLIAFTYAAIFNKISFKHLGNICISLFLLSMMTPFIEYFVGGDGYTLTFHDKLPTSFTEADWTQAQDCGANCPQSTNGSSVGGAQGGVSAGSVGSAQGNGAAGVAESAGTKTDTSTAAQVAKSGNNAAVGGEKTTKVASALAQEPVDNRTGWQKLKDGIKKGVGYIRDAKNAADAGMATVAAVAAAGRNIYEAGANTVDSVRNADWSNPESVYNSINSIGNDAFTSVANVGNNVKSALGAVTTGAGTIGNIYVDKKGEKTVGNKVSDALQSTVDVVNDIGEMNSDVSAGFNMTTGTHGYVKQGKDIWNTVSHPR